MSALDNLNYLKRVARHPCAAPGPVIMIETALRASWPLLLVPWTFSCTDWIKSSVGISWKCGRKLKGVAKAVYGPKFIDGIHWLYGLGPAQVETALWYWFLADLGTGFVADWTTLIYEEAGCEVPGAGSLTCPLFVEMTIPDYIYNVVIRCTDGRNCGSIGSDAIRVVPGCVAQISFVMDFAPFHPEIYGNGSVTTWIEDDEGKQYSVSTTDLRDTKSSKHTGGLVVQKHPLEFLDRTYRIKAKTSGGVIFSGNDSTVWVTFSGRPMPLIPAGCFTPHREPTEEQQKWPYNPSAGEPGPFNKPGNFFGVGGTIGANPKPKQPHQPKRKDGAKPKPKPRHRKPKA